MVDDDTGAEAFEISMTKDEPEEEDVDFGAIIEQVGAPSLSDTSSDLVLSTIDKVVDFADKTRTTRMKEELEERKMVKNNHMVTLSVVMHRGAGCDPQNVVRVNVVASAQFAIVQQAILERMGKRWDPAAKLHLSWLKDDGVQVELSQTSWRDFIFTMWCTQPWVVHAHATYPGDAAEVGMPLHEIARTLFERYDINRNGLIERAELARLLKDVRLERFQCSPALVSRFCNHEFDRLDIDGSGGIDLVEFTKYVTNMTAWMRSELLELFPASAMFDYMAGKAVEEIFPPTALPNDDSLDDDEEVAVIKTGIFGIRLEIPMSALPDAMRFKVSVRTLADSTVSYLCDGQVKDVSQDAETDFAKSRSATSKSLDDEGPMGARRASS